MILERAPLIAALTVALTIAPHARADDQDASEASDLAAAASLAASVGEYTYAIEAFEAADALEPRSDLLFSIAEAHRQRFAIEQSAADRSDAIAYYRRYLEASPDGGRAGDATRSLEKLSTSAHDDTSQTPPSQPRRDAAAPLAVTSPAARAVVSVDGGTPHHLPAFLELPPGRHVLTVSAVGYLNGIAAVSLAPRRPAVLAITLDPAPARLNVGKPSEGDVYVDGVAVGAAPLEHPLEVDPGHHTVTLAMNGHRSVTEDVAVSRGETKTLAPVLERTTQRTAAFALIGTGGVGLASGIALGVVAIVKDRAASNITSGPGQMLSAAEQSHHDKLTADRDRFRLGSGIAAGVGLTTMVVGGILFAFDSTAIPAAKAHRSASIPTFVPVFGPGFAGGQALLRFE